MFALLRLPVFYRYTSFPMTLRGANGNTVGNFTQRDSVPLSIPGSPSPVCGLTGGTSNVSSLLVSGAMPAIGGLMMAGAFVYRLFTQGAAIAWVGGALYS
jgi:hypothetical protein